MKYRIDRQGVTRDKYGRAMAFDSRAAERRRKLYEPGRHFSVMQSPKTPLVKLA